MGLWTDYTKKDTPEDNDTLMLYDAAGKANKQILFSGLWKWVAKKLKEATLSDLQTTDKTMIGAINELNSNSFLLGKSIGTANTKNLNNIHDGIYFYNGWGWDLNPPTNGTVPFINGTGIWIRMTLDASTIDIVISGKDAIIYTSENKANSWTTK